MLIALRAILLVLFIAAPFGEPRTAADAYRVPAEFAVDGFLNCPEAGHVPGEADLWTAGERTVAGPAIPGENA